MTSYSHSGRAFLSSDRAPRVAGAAATKATVSGLSSSTGSKATNLVTCTRKVSSGEGLTIRPHYPDWPPQSQLVVFPLCPRNFELRHPTFSHKRRGKLTNSPICPIPNTRPTT